MCTHTHTQKLKPKMLGNCLNNILVVPCLSMAPWPVASQVLRGGPACPWVALYHMVPHTAPWGQTFSFPLRGTLWSVTTSQKHEPPAKAQLSR